MSSRSTADVCTAVPDIVSKDFNMSTATLSMTLVMSKAFYRIWHGSLQKFLPFFLFSLNNKQLQVILDENPHQKSLNDDGIVLDSIVGSNLFLSLCQ